MRRHWRGSVAAIPARLVAMNSILPRRFISAIRCSRPPKTWRRARCRGRSGWPMRYTCSTCRQTSIRFPRFQFVDRFIAIVVQNLRARGIELEGNRMLVCLHVEHVYLIGQPDRPRHRALRQVFGGREQRIAEMNLRGKIEFIATSLAGIAATEPRQSLRIGDYRRERPWLTRQIRKRRGGEEQDPYPHDAFAAR